MRRSDFDRLNAQRAERGLPTFANPRNTAAGGIRQLDPKATAERKLSFYAYAVGEIDADAVPRTQYELLEYLHALGFRVNEHARRVPSIATSSPSCRNGRSGARRSTIEIDGVVVKVDDLALQAKLGTAGKDPRWAIAFKFRAREAQTKLLDIVVSVGRTGVLNPTRSSSPCRSAERPSPTRPLHNQDYIRNNDIRIGDVVTVIRAGDVIPRVVGPVLELRKKKLPVYSLPEHCPVCGADVDHPEGEPMARCTNASCPAQLVERLRHFASRGAMDIEGIGDQLAAALVENALVNDVSDVYHLSLEQLRALPRMAEKSASNVLPRSSDRSLAVSHGCYRVVSASWLAECRILPATSVRSTRWLPRARKTCCAARDRAGDRAQRRTVLRTGAEPRDDRASAARGGRHDRPAARPRARRRARRQDVGAHRHAA